MRLAVLGQGYVGLTLAASAAEAGFSVVGVDIDAARVDALSSGTQVVAGVPDELFARAFGTGRMRFSTSADAVVDADVVCICVPTPLRDHAPDLSYVEAAARAVASRLRPGTLVILESTTYPGSTESIVQPILESSGLVAGLDFLLAYSPERIDPGNAVFGMRNTPRVVGGHTPAATDAALAFYGQLVDKVLPVSTMRAAETAKLFENTFRHVNIALVNELAVLCHELGVDVWEVIDAAASKPFGFMPFSPGPGVGGHCIPLDPTYLAWQVRRESGQRFRLLEQAEDINEGMPNHVAARVAEILNDQGRSVKGATILVLGVTYKSDVGDVRESPSLHTMDTLHRKGADVRFHDFFVEEAPVDHQAVVRVDDLDVAVAEADIVVLLTPHSAYDLDAIAQRARVVFDARNAYGQRRPENVIRL